MTYGPRMYFGPADGDPSTRRAVRLLTGLTDEQLTDLGGFADEERGTMPTPKTTTALSDLTGAEHRSALRLWDFSRVLVAAGLLDDDQVGYFFEKPWKWEREHAVWRAHGCPDLNGDADRFDAFAEAARSDEGDEG